MLQADVASPQEVSYIEVDKIDFIQILFLGFCSDQIFTVNSIMLVNPLARLKSDWEKRVDELIQVLEGKLVEDLLNPASKNAYIRILFNIHTLEVLSWKDCLQLFVIFFQILEVLFHFHPLVYSCLVEKLLLLDFAVPQLGLPNLGITSINHSFIDFEFKKPIPNLVISLLEFLIQWFCPLGDYSWNRSMVSPKFAWSNFFLVEGFHLRGYLLANSIKWAFFLLKLHELLCDFVFWLDNFLDFFLINIDGFKLLKIRRSSPIS